MSIPKPKGPYVNAAWNGPINGSLSSIDNSSFKKLLTIQLNTAFNASLYHHGRGYLYWRLEEVTVEIQPAKAVPDGNWGLCFKQDVALPDPATTAECEPYTPSKLVELKQVIKIKFRPSDKGFKYCRDVTTTTEDRLEGYGTMIVWSELAGAAITNPGLIFLKGLKVQFASPRPIASTSVEKPLTVLSAKVVQDTPMIGYIGSDGKMATLTGSPGMSKSEWTQYFKEKTGLEEHPQGSLFKTPVSWMMASK